MDALFNNRERFQKHANVLQSLRHLHNELCVVDVVFSQKSVAKVDAPLEVGIVGGHVVRADQVIETSPRSPNCGDDIISRLQLSHIRTNRFHPAETFMSDDQKVVSRRSCAVFCGIDLFVGAIHSDAKNSNQHSSPIGNLVD